MIRYFLFVFVFCISSVGGQNFPSKPNNYVSDMSDVLTYEQEESLNRQLSSYEQSTSNQFFVLIMDSLNGSDMASLCQDVFTSWHIGVKEKNNGVLIALFIKDHKFRIHTGYGLEGALPDLRTKDIQDNVMRPAFKEGKYYEGLLLGIGELIKYSQGEFTTSAPKPYKSIPWWIYAYIINGLLLITLILILIFKPLPNKSHRNELLGWGIFVCLMPVLGSLVTLALIIAGLQINYKRYGLLFKHVKRNDRSNRKEKNDSPSWGFFSGWSSSDSGSFDSFGSSDSGGSDFGGGGGGDSGGGGSDSSW